MSKTKLKYLSNKQLQIEPHLFLVTSLSVDCGTLQVKLPMHANLGAEDTAHEQPI